MADERTPAQESVYHIRIRGSLDPKWADWFEGFVVGSRASGETLLSGNEVDQAALHGVLGKIHSLGLSLLLVVHTTCPCPEKRCPRHGQCGPCAIFRDTRGELPYCFRSGTGWEKQVAMLKITK